MAANRQTISGSNPAISFGGDIPSGSFNLQKLDAAKYISLYDLVNKPDNRDALIKTYGNQGITGFLQLVGATKAVGMADEVQYWEETRLHKKQAGALATIAGGDTTVVLTASSAANVIARDNDIVLVNGSERAMVSISGTAITLTSLLAGGFTALAGAAAELPIVGNLWGQGTDQPTEFIESGVVKRTNPFMIMKDVYSVTGSQATNVGWINLGNGDYRWYLKSEGDTRQRFMDKREMMMLLGEKVTNTAIYNASAAPADGNPTYGSEGYFSAIEDRGIVSGGYLQSLTDVDDLIKALDKEGGSSEYAMYVNRTQDLHLDDLISAAGDSSTTTGAAKFGSFSNSAETALNLGFRSFNRAGYTFHKHDWKLLNDPTLLADSDYAGVCVPMAQIADARTGDKAPALEMNYKASNGYSREMEHWMVGSILGASNATKDNVEFHYRSECNLVTRAANRHILIKKA
tara:strand:+ start:1192 stop:2574 length:1383 start_codon:yes stop_codon:yes gene_type:complete